VAGIRFNMTSLFSTRVKNINKHTQHTHTLKSIMLQEPAHQKGDGPQCQASTKKGKNTRARQRSRER